MRAPQPAKSPHFKTKPRKISWRVLTFSALTMEAVETGTLAHNASLYERLIWPKQLAFLGWLYRLSGSKQNGFPTGTDSIQYSSGQWGRSIGTRGFGAVIDLESIHWYGIKKLEFFPIPGSERKSILICLSLEDHVIYLNSSQTRICYCPYLWPELI